MGRIKWSLCMNQRLRLLVLLQLTLLIQVAGRASSIQGPASVPFRGVGGSGDK
jgi:hypothetical protein